MTSQVRSYTYLHRPLHTWAIKLTAFASGSFHSPRGGVGWLKVLLGQASLVFKKEKTLVNIWVWCIIEIHSRYCFLWSNRWNLIFQSLVIRLPQYLEKKKEEAWIAKELTICIITLPLPGMQCKDSYALFHAKLQSWL